MAETTGWRQQFRKPMAGLFYLASELDAGAEAMVRRRREKYQVLLSAGVLLPTVGPWDDPEAAMFMMADTCEIKPPYPKGTSSAGGSTGSTKR
jgi:hypothetical protein